MIIVDVETSGLDENKNSILSVGAIEWGNPGNEFYMECKPWEGAEVHDKALEVNGFTRDYLDDLTFTPGEICLTFGNWARDIEDHTFTGYNIHFDYKFLQAQFKRSNIKWPFGFRWVDAHSIAYWSLDPELRPVYYGNSSLSLDKALELFFLEPEEKPHNALTGARKVYELLEAIRDA
jgi:DNA polymerase III epsilon subunit-like protein